MISARLFLLGSTLCVGACMGSGYPTIQPIATQTTSHETLSERAYREGKYQLARGHAGLAIIAFERASRLDPLAVGALNGIGAAYDDLKRYDIALGYYKRALLLAPQNADTTNNIAVSLRLAGDPAANEWFARAAKLDPANDTIAANIVQARADDADLQEPRQPLSPRPLSPARPDSALSTIADDSGPTLQRSGVAEFQLGLVNAAATGADLRQPLEATVIPVVGRIDPSPQRAAENPPAPIPPPVSPVPTHPITTAAVSSTTNITSAQKRASPVITVSNCVGRTHMARRFRAFFQGNDISVRRLVNAPSFDCEKTRLLARAGREHQAEALAQLLPLPITTEMDEAMTDDVRLVLGRDLVAFDRTLGE